MPGAHGFRIMPYAIASIKRISSQTRIEFRSWIATDRTLILLSVPQYSYPFLYPAGMDTESVVGGFSTALAWNYDVILANPRSSRCHVVKSIPFSNDYLLWIPLNEQWVFCLDLNSCTATTSRTFWECSEEKHCFVWENVMKYGAYLLKRIDHFELARKPAALKVVKLDSRLWTHKHLMSWQKIRNYSRRWNPTILMHSGR